MIDNVLYVESLNSTNDYLANLSRENILENFTSVFCGIQNKGKGQRDNVWYSSPFKNLTFSTILYPNIEPKNSFDLNIMVSLAIKKVIEPILKKNIQIKWPNDIYINEKKICGILIENTINKNLISKSIVGIGLNVNEEKFPDYIPNPTSIFLETNTIYDIKIILNNLIFNIKDIYLDFYKNIDKYKKIYKESILFINKQRMFKDKEHIFKGEIINISDEGKLIVKEGIEIKEYYFKEIEYIF